MGNPQSPGILDLTSKSKISQFNLLVDLKAQSKHCDKQHPVRIFVKFLNLKMGRFETILDFLNLLMRDQIIKKNLWKLLNMNPNSDKECGKRVNIVLLSENQKDCRIRFPYVISSQKYLN